MTLKIIYKRMNEMKTDNMDFSQALLMLKKGAKISRSGWNGKTQYLELATNVSYKNLSGKIVNANNEDMGNRAIAFVNPLGGVQIGWLASQADMLAEDWQVKE